MKETLKLKNSIKINGVDVAEMSYDTNEITTQLFAEAESRRKVAAGTNGARTIVPAAEFDFGLHLYLGVAAIVAVNPQYDFNDLERLHGRDVVEVMKIGRNFILKSESSKENNSDEQSETTPGPSTPASPSSKSGE